MKKLVLFFVPVVVIAVLSFRGIEQKNQIAKSVCDSLQISAQEHLTMAVLWYQRSAEMKALYIQSYNMAKISLENQIKKSSSGDKLAVVLDIDETVLDNSPYEAMMIEKGFSHSVKSWKEWTKLAIAKPLPGVIDFLLFVKSKGIEAFYVSNRETDEREATLKNMINEKIPFADTSHIYLKGKESNKTARYNEINKKYKIVLTIGDNLRDFNEVFGNRKNNYGLNIVDSLKTQLRENFILLPNPMYGDWEKAIYGGKYPSEPEKNKLRKLALKSY